MAADKAKTMKTFIVQRTFEFIVEAFSRDEAISIASAKEITADREVGVKCGTPKQMKRDDVR